MSNRTSRIQTTVNISSDAVEALDALARASSVSRSRLVDLALRRFIRWAEPVRPQDLKLIADYEVSEPTAGFLRRRTTTVPPAPINGDEEGFEVEGVVLEPVLPRPPRAPVYAGPDIQVKRSKGERPKR